MMSDNYSACLSLLHLTRCGERSSRSECKNLHILCESESKTVYNQHGNGYKENVYKSAPYDDSDKDFRVNFLQGCNEQTGEMLVTEEKIEVDLRGFDGYMITIIFLLIVFILVIFREFRKSRNCEQLNKPEFVVG